VVPDLYQVVPEHGLGLVDAEVYRRMCGSMRNQVLRIWSPRNGALSLLAAVLRAVEFQVDTHYEPPSSARLNELRDLMLKTVASWSDDELSVCVPGHGPSLDFVACKDAASLCQGATSDTLSFEDGCVYLFRKTQ
jgi:hypothetical protein